MKKLVTILCVLMAFSMLVSCGGQGTTTNNEPKSTTTKNENVVDTQKNEQVLEVKTTKPAETPKIDEKKEQVLIELMTMKKICEFNMIRGDYLDDYKDMTRFIESSKTLTQELKNKLLEPMNSHDNYGDFRFKAILDLEIEKHKLP